MNTRRIRLPKENATEADTKSTDYIGDDDVTGHGFPMPAPPADFAPRSPSHGGEIVPSDDDAEDNRQS